MIYLKKKALLLINFVILVLEIIGLIYGIKNRGLSLFLYYTQISNILALVSTALLLIFIIKGKYPPFLSALRYMSATTLAITFLVVLFVLAPMAAVPGGPGFFSMYIGGSLPYHHFFCPILIFLSFVLLEPSPDYSRKNCALAVIPTVVYAVVLIVLNLTRLTVGPYPFLQVYDQPVYVSIIFGVVILSAAYFIGALTLKLATKKQGKEKK